MSAFDDAVRRAHALILDVLDDSLPAREQVRAMDSLDALTLRHGITQSDFATMRAKESEKADRAAAYIDAREKTKGWLMVEQLGIARGMAGSGEIQLIRVLRALEANVIRKATAMYRADAADRKRGTIKSVEQPQDIAA